MRVACALLAAILMLAINRAATCRAAEAAAWRQPASVTWSGAALRDALRRFADAQSLFVLIDRRVDAGRELELSAAQAPAREIMLSAGKQADAGVSFLGPLAYLGPESSCRRLATTAALRTQEAQRLPTELRKALLERGAYHWDDFATPKELIETSAKEADLQVEGLELIPHDLWAGAKLPPLTLVARLTIILAQFDLTFHVDAERKSLVLEPLPERVSIEKDYAGGAKAQQRAEAWRARTPAAEIEVRGQRIVVRGTVEEHETLASPDKPDPRPNAPAPGVQVYTLTVSGKPLSAVLPQLAKQLQLELKLDEASLQANGTTLDHIVELQVKEATLKQLLDELFKNSRLAYQVDLDQKTLTVTATHE
ncbi:MAG: hypothetical protein SGJ19_03310 [Planctomycetia bacterium]|nr:hypothetical protein [Planctomycetia bacterium]